MATRGTQVNWDSTLMKDSQYLCSPMLQKWVYRSYTFREMCINSPSYDLFAGLRRLVNSFLVLASEQDPSLIRMDESCSLALLVL